MNYTACRPTKGVRDFLSGGYSAILGKEHYRRHFEGSQNGRPKVLGWQSLSALAEQGH